MHQKLNWPLVVGDPTFYDSNSPKHSERVPESHVPPKTSADSPDGWWTPLEGSEGLRFSRSPGWIHMNSRAPVGCTPKASSKMLEKTRDFRFFFRGALGYQKIEPTPAIWATGRVNRAVSMWAKGWASRHFLLFLCIKGIQRFFIFHPSPVVDL